MSSSNQQAKQPITHGGYPSIGTASPSPTLSGSFNFSSNVGVGTVGSPIDSAKIQVNQIAARPIGAEIMRIGEMVAGRFEVSFCENENGVWTKATLQPDVTMSPSESLRISLLVTSTMGLAAVGADLSSVKPLTYIRAYGLERHFSFSVI